MTAFADPSSESATPPAWEAMLASCRLDLHLLGPGLELGSIGIAVLVEGDSGRRTWDASCELAFTACEMEVLGEAGPGTQALDSRDVVRVADLVEDQRWPRWRKVALGLRWRSVLAAPVSLEVGSGAVVVYGRDRADLAGLHGT